MRLTGLLALLALTSTTLSQLMAQTPPPPPTRSAPPLQLPERVGAFSIVSRHVYDTLDAGMSAQYSDGGPMTINAYIYPIINFADLAPGATVPPERALAREVRLFKASLDSGVARGWWDTYRIAYEEDASLDLHTEVIPGSLVMTVLGRPSSIEASAFYIFDIDSQFVKIRINAPYDAFDGGRHMTDFQEALITLIASTHN